MWIVVWIRVDTGGWACVGVCVCRCVWACGRVGVRERVVMVVYAWTGLEGLNSACEVLCGLGRQLESLGPI